ncbi:MAG: hypothetical protein ACP5NF_01835 [Thermoanaerobaculum sp.]
MARGRLAFGLALLAASAWGQTVYLGAGVGAVWERHAPVAPGKEWFHSDRTGESAFLALPVEEGTAFRVERVDLPRDVRWGGGRWEARLAGWTAGIDYFLPGVWGKALVAGGLGAYRLDLAARTPPEGLEDTRFGWYLKVGEWFSVTRRLTFAAEVAYHRTNHRGQPQLLTASGLLVLKF